MSKVTSNTQTTLLLTSNIIKAASHNPLTSIAAALSGYTFLRYTYLKFYRWYYKLPPGPTGLPFVGITPAVILNLISQRKYFNSTGNSRLFSKYYGGIISFWVRSSTTIQINDAQLCKKVLKNKSALDRPNAFKDGFGLISDPKSKAVSFVALNGKDWMWRRKYAQTALGKVSTNKFLDMVISQCMYDTIFPMFGKIINKDSDIMGNEDDTNNESLWFPRKICAYVAFRTIFHSNFGHKIDYEDELHKQMISLTREQTTGKAITRNVLLSMFKPLRKVGFLTDPFFEWTDRRNKLIDEIIKKRLKSKEFNIDKPASYIDHCVKLEKEGKISRKELILDVYLFFLAGSETTSNNLEHGIIHLCNKENVQDLVRNELMSVFDGKNDKGFREFHLSKWNECPLHRALVHEILRVASVVPDGVQHKAKKEIKVEYSGKEYIIPKGASIQYNTWHIHKNSKKENWINHERVLCLENWLEKDLKRNKMKFVHNDSHVTFGLGRRDCIGKHLAIKEMASVLGYLLLNYKFSFKDKKHFENSTVAQIGFAMIDPQIGVQVERI